MLKKWFPVLVILICVIFAVSSGCSENSEEDTNVPEESIEDINEEEASEEDTEEEVEVEMVTGDTSDWCAVGSSWKSTNPQTGEEVTMEIVGTETVDGVLMCKAVYATNVEDEDVSKIEYLWSEDGTTYFWTAYDASGDIVSQMSMKEGKMKIVDEEGNVMEYSQGQ